MRDSPPTIREIQVAVAHHFGVTVLDLVSDRRSLVIARPRQVAMWLARHITTHSIPAIGRAFGGRDHTTVMHAIKRIEELRTQDSRLATDLWKLVTTVDCGDIAVARLRGTIRIVA